MRSLGAIPDGQRLERMKASRIWSGGRFQNITPVLPNLLDQSGGMPSLGEFIWGGERRIPSGSLPVMNPLDGWRHAPSSGLRATWLGHSTVFIEIDGSRVLTDPVWGKRASPSQVLGPKRFQKAPVPLAALPEIDIVLISHDHYDHLDYPTIRELARRGPLFIAPLGVGAHLEAWGVMPERIVELDWWESYTPPRGSLRVTATPAQHFSGRSLGGRNTTLWSSFVVESPDHRVFFSGDTGLTTDYELIRARFAPFDLIMLEVGAFHPAWGHIHLGPQNAIRAVTMLGGGPLLPIHWGTFNLALHAWDEPAESLLRMAPLSGTHLVMPQLGQPTEPSRDQLVMPWWREVDRGSRSEVRFVEHPSPPPGIPVPID